MVGRTVSNLKTRGRLTEVKVWVAVFRLLLVAGWPAVFILTDNTDVHHVYLLASGNVVSFLHSGLNDCLLAHVSVAGTFLSSLLFRPPYRIWGIGSLAYVAVMFASSIIVRRLDKRPSWYEFFRVPEKPA
jgi:hypothetical protein